MEYSSNSDKITREYFDSLLLESRYLDSGIPLTKMPLLKEGSDKVAERICGMNGELAGVMARTGVKTLSEMDSSVIHKRDF